MATRIFDGGGIDRAKVYTLTPTAPSSGTATYTVTTNGNDATYFSAAAETLATICSGIVAAVQGADAPEWEDMTPATNGTTVTMTAAEVGEDFTISVSFTGTGSNLTSNVTTTNKSRGDWSDTANWQGNVVPINGDDVIIEKTDVSIDTGLNQAGVTLASLTIRDTFTGDLGRPDTNPKGYLEYRDAKLLLAGATILRIDHGAADSAGRFDHGRHVLAATINGP